MGLEHKFYLVSETIEINEIWTLIENIRVIDNVVIHDDIVHYISDSLEWIPSKNPAKKGNPNGRGINYYGVTLFDEQSSKLLKGIFTSWRDLFENAPNTFEITGNFVYGDNEQDGEYERININRDEVINQLGKIISMSEHLAKGNCYLYHLGI
ncbi:hypothetical protein SAMN05443252_10914 [Bacillus sp. OV322]|uniref:hypothetical protein n=1 Tax=Bacillus sp. OV322 TaxID=1882764 RepID=UPI0008E9CB97|nr:hypothetical protein [Bacillus sp. OV322]SFC93718.1 hypothetical protein SAMN05443252_10914 [Bacillus sp. OV322]